MDWPRTNWVVPTVISTASRESIGQNFVRSNPGSGTWPANNRALFVPIVLPGPVRVKRLFAVNGAAASGNIDMGLYRQDGVKIITAGSTMQTGTNQPQFFNITDTDLAPGRYYLAIALSSTVGTNYRWNFPLGLMQLTGLAQMASAFALPDPITFTQAANAYMPWCGMEIGRVL